MDGLWGDDWDVGEVGACVGGSVGQQKGCDRDVDVSEVKLR